METRSAFFYGTLMAPQVLHRVLFGSTSPHSSQLEALRIQPAILLRYVRRRVAQCDYPAIQPSFEPSACVRGTFVHGLTPADLWRLDIFEGDQYERVKVRVQLLELVDKQENEVEAETYVWSGLDDDLEKSEWDFEEFRREKMFRWVGGSKEYEEVDEAVEKADTEKDPTGGRFTNGRMTDGLEGDRKLQETVIESAI